MAMGEWVVVVLSLVLLFAGGWVFIGLNIYGDLEEPNAVIQVGSSRCHQLLALPVLLETDSTTLRGSFKVPSPFIFSFCRASSRGCPEPSSRPSPGFRLGASL